MSIFLMTVLLLFLQPQSANAYPVMDYQKQDLAEKIARQIVAGMPSWVDTDEEKVMYLYDYITETVTYEFNDDDQTAYGSLVKGKCVCAGYARGLDLLLNTAGIEAGTKTGWNMTTREGHEWTYLYLGGIMLYADPTWGDLDWEWNHIDWHPAKRNHYGMTMTEKQERETHAEYIFLDGVYDGSGDDTGREYSYAGILERSGVPVGHFNRETTPEEVLPYFQVLHYDGTNALIRAVYYYEEGEYDHHHTFAADNAANMFLDSVTESWTITGEECEVYYWGPISDYDPIPADSVVLRTSQERETRKGEPLIVTAEVFPYEASNKRVIYSSSDPSIATVDSFGKVTGINEGTAVITATSEDGGYSDSIEITITSDHYHDSWLRNILEKAPTCEQPGCKMYFLCETCGAWFPDYWAYAEIKDHNSWLIPALGHAESGWMSDDAGHWKQCTRSGCAKIMQGKAAHSDGNGDGLCDLCSYRTAEQTQPTTSPTESTVPTTVPAPTTEPTQPSAPTEMPTLTTAPTQPATVTTKPSNTTHASSVPATETAPGATPEPPRTQNDWILYAAVAVAVIVPVLILLLRRKRRNND